MVLRLRFLHDGRDFSSACVHSAQSGPRILTAIGLLTGMGDAHHHLDVPASGGFDAEDFRVRYQLLGEGVAGKEGFGRPLRALRRLSQGGDPHPGRFGKHELTWEMEQAEGRVCLDGVCCRGPPQFDPAGWAMW